MNCTMDLSYTSVSSKSKIHLDSIFDKAACIMHRQRLPDHPNRRVSMQEITYQMDCFRNTVEVRMIINKLTIMLYIFCHPIISLN